MNSIKKFKNLDFLPIKQENLCIANKIPLFMEYIAAGFPSPAQDFIEKRIDLNQLLIKHPAATYLLRVSGESMNEGYIQDGDLVVVDSAKKPKHGDIVIANVSGEFTIKKLCLIPQLMLKPMNQNFHPIIINNPDDLNIFGVVTFIIHQA
ncbi:translesion error-prone DNA polymerase V autoproteolytic subunit [Frischella sp. Ac48]|uniref:Translesion error-prone DNA polymerase V autoproteolytic subunit n=2 Tax=Orbaceae TaxID=1240483 RepID=A0ABR7QYL4_9GAMM|nr:translesion error-prone DNA polymerase V autoproteolytic subunit [Frischella japonica]MBX4132284.1 translesion error-prone DNA polymerase V autoproteolytic subunit [Frischella sp. Ac48]